MRLRTTNCPRWTKDWLGILRNSRRTAGSGSSAPIRRSSTAIISGRQLHFLRHGRDARLNYDILTTTNLALPVAQWSNVNSGQFDAAGAFNVLLPLDSATAQRYYRLRAR